MSEEIWMPVVGWEGLYEVSNTGMVRSLTRLVKFGHGKRLSEGRVLAQIKSPDGYGIVILSNGSVRETRHVHRLVARAFLNGNGAVVRHLDGDGSNNHASNLAYGSFKENEADKARHGRVPRGETHKRSVLNEELVREIRRLHANGFTQLRIAADLGLKRGVVGTVVRRERWKHVT